MSIVNFIQKNTQAGCIEILSDAISVDVLCFLKNDACFKQTQQWNILLRNVPTHITYDFCIDLLAGGKSINSAFLLNYNIQQAIDFFQCSNVCVQKLDASHTCSANIFIFAAKPPSCSYAIRSDLPFSDKVIGFDGNSDNSCELPVITCSGDTGASELPATVQRYTEAFKQLWEQHAQPNIVVGQGQAPFKDVLREHLKTMLREYTPREIYEQVLFHKYHDILMQNNDPDDLLFFRDTAICNHLRDYQKIALSHLIRKMEDYGGVFLADAVGLGKTWTALGVIKYYQMQGYQVFVIVPHSVKSDWEQYKQFNGSELERDAFNFELISHTDLGARVQNNQNLMNRLDNPDTRCLFVIDEAHNFRNNNTRTQFLNDILQKQRTQTKVLLLTATPVNLDMKDLKKQIRLIALGRTDAFEQSLGIGNVENLIDRASNDIRRARTATPGIPVTELHNRLPEEFKRLMSALIVARTRQQLRDAGIEINTPRANPAETCQCNQLEQGQISVEDFIDNYIPLHMTAYSPKTYFVPFAQAFDNENLRSVHLKGMLQTMILKRLESSWYCCQASIERMYEKFRQLARVLDNRQNPGQLDLHFNEDELNDLEENNPYEDVELPDTITENDLEQIRNAGQIDIFREDLCDDIRKFNDLRNMFNQFSAEHDTKLNILKERIRQRWAAPRNNGRRRILIFTTFAETAEYLQVQLSQEFNHVAMITGATRARDRHAILDRFAPYTRLFRNFNPENLAFDEWQEWILANREGRDICRKAAEALENPVEILVSTDCLSEGTNLQDADFVVDYDIHWNPVRLLQRLGRINRVESPNTEIDALNFHPQEEMEAVLNLVKRINQRIVSAAIGRGEINLQALDDNGRAEIQNFQNLVDNREVARIRQDMQNVMENWALGNAVAGDGFQFSDFPQDQTFLDALNAKRDNPAWCKRVPNGIFSGALPENAETAQGYLFLLQAPNDGENVDSFQLIHLNCDGELVSGDWNQNIRLLAELKENKRRISRSLTQVDTEYLNGVARKLMNYLTNDAAQQENNDFVNALLNQVPVQTATQTTDYQLICWMEL